MHTTRSFLFRVVPGFAALLLALGAAPTAQSARTTAGSRSAVHPQAIEALAPAAPALHVQRHSVWLEVPRDAAGPLEVELVALARPALLAVDIQPPLVQARPGSLARFSVTLRGRPAFLGGAFTLAFRERASGTTLGEIPVDVQRGVGGARSTKEAAYATLEELLAEVRAGAYTLGDRDEGIAKLEHALEELGESLEPELWAKDEFGVIQQDRLDEEEGADVFHEERECAQKIFDAIRQGEISDEELRAELLGIVDTLVFADRLLAETAIFDALAAGGDAEEIAEAEEHLAEGDALVAAAAEESDLRMVAALLYAAMDGEYRHAWKEAVDSH